MEIFNEEQTCDNVIEKENIENENKELPLTVQ